VSGPGSERPGSRLATQHLRFCFEEVPSFGTIRPGASPPRRRCVARRHVRRPARISSRSSSSRRIAEVRPRCQPQDCCGERPDSRLLGRRRRESGSSLTVVPHESTGRSGPRPGLAVQRHVACVEDGQTPATVRRWPALDWWCPHEQTCPMLASDPGPGRRNPVDHRNVRPAWRASDLLRRKT
jgi:hypothetical protein